MNQSHTPPVLKEVFVVNLKHCTNRIRTIDEHLRSINLPYTRWDAVYGKNLSNNDIASITSNACVHFLCNKSVIGCYLSHVTLWKHIFDTYKNTVAINSNMWFIIFEDDIKTNKGFLNNIDRLLTSDLLPTNPAWITHRYPQLIHLWCTIGCNKNPTTPNLFPAHFITGTGAYMVSYSGIFTLLEHVAQQIKYHIDVTISLKQIMYDRLALYTTHNYIDINDNGVSTISQHTIPLIPPLILKQILPNHHAMMYSQIFHIGPFNFNFCILLYLVPFLALLVTQRHIWVIPLIITLEIIVYITIMITQANYQHKSSC